MKAKVKRGNGFRGVLEYALGPGEHDQPGRAEIVGGNLSGTTPRELAAEFGVTRRQRPGVKNPVWHCSLALPKGEQLDSNAWHQVCERHLQLMGIDTGNHMWVAVRHSDTEYDHVHLIVSRIGLDATLWHGRNDVMAAIESTQTLEREFGLRLTTGLNSEPEHPKRTKGEAAKKKRTGQASVKERMQSILNKAMQTGSFEAFVKACQADGLQLQPNLASTGRVSGFSFRLDGAVMKASDLGSTYKWARLAKKTGFELARHMPLIQELAALAKAREEAEPAATLEAVKVDQAERPARRNRTIDLLFVCLDDGLYAWKKSQAPAFRDLGDRIRFDRTPEAAVKAALQLAREKGWAEVETVGSIDFRRRAWLEGRLQGIKVTGYEPSTDDLVALIESRRDLAVRIAQKEADPLLRQIRILKAGGEAKLEAHRAIFGEVPSAEIVGSTVRSDQHEFAERHADEGYREAKRRASVSRAALKTAQLGRSRPRFLGASATQAKHKSDRDWADYLAHCQRIISGAMTDRVRLILQVEDMAFWLREIRAGRMPMELQNAIDGRIGPKPHAAAIDATLRHRPDTNAKRANDAGHGEIDGRGHWTASDAERPGKRLR
ncbi:Large polyvalent protein-associated domain 7 [compost metagenome]